MKKIRITIIVICTIIMIPSIIRAIPDLRNDYGSNADIYKVDQVLLIDDDEFIVERIIIDDDNTYLEYKLVRSEHGAAFPKNAISISNISAERLRHGGSSSSSKLWGEQGVIEFERTINVEEPVIIKFEWYDRENEVIINLIK